MMVFSVSKLIPIADARRPPSRPVVEVYWLARV
jgi:hypothetical protein